MRYIDSEKLIAKIERRMNILDVESPFGVGGRVELELVLSTITSLQQEQPKGNLEYWLEHFGMPKENIDNCITQIAQGYGACRYLEGIQHGAEAVNELAKQEQPEVDLEKEIDKEWKKCNPIDEGMGVEMAYIHIEAFDIIARHFYELGRLNARKEE